MTKWVGWCAWCGKRTEEGEAPQPRCCLDCDERNRADAGTRTRTAALTTRPFSHLNYARILKRIVWR